ncbi:hypothetical protein FACS1894184_03480 [Clostridia bacterium]|nr:hypothetical protein FACS1894184_03480 [Clostridia bacterium]
MGTQSDIALVEAMDRSGLVDSSVLIGSGYQRQPVVAGLYQATNNCPVSSKGEIVSGREICPSMSDDELAGLLDSLDTMLHHERQKSIEEQFPIAPGREFVYCLQVMANRQNAIAVESPNFFPCKAISPLVVHRIWTKNGIEKRQRLLIPGYVFVFSDEAMNPKKFIDVSGVVRVLEYGYGEYALADEDERLARWLLKYDGTIGLSKAVNVGSRIVATEGPLRDYVGRVGRIDKSRRRAQVVFSFVNTAWKSWLDFDWFDVSEEMKELLKRRIF